MPSDRTPVLFVLAHPDDEFACSMWMRALVCEGRRVGVAYLTDGGFGGQATARREAESLRVLGRLGVAAADVAFLGRLHGWPDGGLHGHLDQAAARLGEWVDGFGGDASLVVPAWEGGHQDHDATHLVGWSVARVRGFRDVWQIPLYTGAGLPGPFFRVLRTLRENGPVEAYRASWRERLEAIGLCFEYASQWRTWVGLLPFLTVHLLLAGTFPRQRLDPRRLHEAPHAGRPLYERRGFLSQAAFRAEADRFISLNLRLHGSET
jgi:LmbE family N-acetylglucosaminyl deacetylase